MQNPLELWAVCHSCKQKHSLHNEAQGAFGYWQDWMVKHPGHDLQLISDAAPPQRKGYRHNADVKEAYATSAACTYPSTRRARALSAPHMFKARFSNVGWFEKLYFQRENVRVK